MNESRNTPSPATVRSVENAITGTLRWRAIGATARTSAASSGPKISSAPLSMASFAAAAACSGLVPVSRGSSTMERAPMSNIAIWAASSNDCATCRVPLFGCDSGNSTAMRTCPATGTGGPPGGGPDGSTAVGRGASVTTGDGLSPQPKPSQAESTTPIVIRRTIVHNVRAKRSG